jgi:hypothetical protein
MERVQLRADYFAGGRFYGVGPTMSRRSADRTTRPHLIAAFRSTSAAGLVAMV